MKVVGNFNKLSDKQKAKIKPLGRNEQVHYRMLTGNFDIATGETRYGSQTSIVLRDTIYDEGTGQLVEIGVPRTIVDGEVKHVKKFNIAPVGENILNNGVFTLYGSSLEHQEIYEFFELSNINISNPDRDPSVQAKIQRIDVLKEAEEEEAGLDTLTKALLIASEMSAADIRAFAAGKNWNVKENPAILRKRVKQYAKDFPEDFITLQNDPEARNKVLIKSALDAGIISYHPHEHKIVWADGKTLAILDKPENGESEVELFLAWTQTSKNGDSIMKSLANKLKNSAEK